MIRDNAVERLTPQMADYDRLGEKVDWRPYVMFFHKAHFRSPSVTTDSYGFRRTVDASGRILTLDDVGNVDTSLLVGNSVAFGVGATSDASCICSRLSFHSRNPWLNFCGRAYGATQELLLFQNYAHKVPRIKQVTILSGSNDLYLFYTPKTFDEIFGAFAYSDKFYATMEGGSALQGPLTQVVGAGLAEKILRRFRGAANAAARITGLLGRDGADADEAEEYAEFVRTRAPQREKVIEHLDRTLEMWSLLARGMGFQLAYVLQPMLPWVEKRWSVEETELVAERDLNGGRGYRILKEILDVYHRDWYVSRLAALCASKNINFVDMNAELSGTDGWLFVDRLHMNDACQDKVARALLTRL